MATFYFNRRWWVTLLVWFWYVIIVSALFPYIGLFPWNIEGDTAQLITIKLSVFHRLVIIMLMPLCFGMSETAVREVLELLGIKIPYQEPDNAHKGQETTYSTPE